MRLAYVVTVAIGLLCACTAGRVGEDPPDAGGGGGMDADIDLDGDVLGRDGDVEGDAGDGGDTEDDGGGEDIDGDVPLPDGSAGGTEGSCDNGVDDDGDGDMDCEDPDCDDEVCDTTSGLRCVTGTCGGCVGASSETSCGDRLDEDCDGMVDCADSDCGGAVCGLGDVRCSGGVCPCPSGFNEVLCGDGTDDDCDLSTDCDDDDCDGRLCGADGEVCLDGACVCPGAGGLELCNGEDDNCSATIDEGCPSGVGGCCETNLFPVGGTAGTPFAELCPTGTALAGVTTWVVAGINGLQPICGELTFVHTETDPEDVFTVVRGALTDGSPQGESAGTMSRDVCPADEWVIGVFGDAGTETSDRVDRIGLRCARLVIERGGGFNWVVSVTATGTTPARGSGFGDPYDARCAGGALMVGLSGRADDNRVHQLGFTCRRVELQTR